MLRHAPNNTEILVVDDASQDHIVSAVANDFADIRCIRLNRRGGFCKAVNAGIAASSGPIVELLNDDTQVSEGWAEAAIHLFNDPKIAAVAPLVLIGPDEDRHDPRIDSAGDRYFLGGIASKRGHLQPVNSEFLTSQKVFGASGSSAFYRRDALLAVGGFPESFGAYFEDVDLSFRLRWAGFEILYEPTSRVWHRVNATYGKPTRRLLCQQACNEERVFWRNLPPGRLWQALPLHLAVLAGKAWRRWREGELFSFLVGKARALGELPTLLKHRQSLLRQRVSDRNLLLDEHFHSGNSASAPLHP